jgi:hypothetical protein
MWSAQLEVKARPQRRFFWAHLPHNAPELIAGHCALLPRLLDALSNRHAMLYDA